MNEVRETSTQIEHEAGAQNVVVEEEIVGYHTPLYLLLSALALALAASLWLPWATVTNPTTDGFATVVTGTDISGTSTLIIIAAIAIAILGPIGYFWNPWSDPEALLILFFSLVAAAHTFTRLRNLAAIVDPLNEYEVTTAAAGTGLMLAMATSVICAVGAVWILATRPSPKYG